MARLFLVRHAETSMNEPGKEVARGILDKPLDAEGIEETHELAALTRTLHPKAIYCSPLQRSRVTAKIIAKIHKVEVIVLDHLLPWDMGYLTGKPLSEVKPELIRLMTVDPNETPKSGESYNDWLSKWLPTLDVLMEEAIEIAPDGDDLIAVTHSRNIRAARMWVKAGRDLTKLDRSILKTNGTDDPASIIPILGPLENGKWVALPAIRTEPERYEPEKGKKKLGS